MILDKQALFSNEQAITGDAASTNIIDTGATADVGRGGKLRVAGVVTAAFNTLTSLNIKLQTSVDEAFTSPIDLWTVNKTLAGSGLAAGVDLKLPEVPQGAKRYLRLYYDVVGTDPTTGKILAGIVLDEQQWAALVSNTGF